MIKICILLILLLSFQESARVRRIIKFIKRRILPCSTSKFREFRELKFTVARARLLKRIKQLEQHSDWLTVMNTVTNFQTPQRFIRVPHAAEYRPRDKIDQISISQVANLNYFFYALHSTTHLNLYSRLHTHEHVLELKDYSAINSTVDL